MSGTMRKMSKRYWSIRDGAKPEKPHYYVSSNGTGLMSFGGSYVFDTVRRIDEWAGRVRYKPIPDKRPSALVLGSLDDRPDICEPQRLILMENGS